MEVVIISLAAFIVAILTFFSGFGLGTILTPVFIIFFPVDLAIALTGVVHFFNNIFKLLLVGRKANQEVLLRFGVPAVLAALAGSLLLLNIPDITPLFSYRAFGKAFHVYPIKFIISVLLLIFACIDLLPYFNRLQFGKEKLPIGGILSGFFGGLSGNQGALRSAFLIRVGLSKEAFIATTAVVSNFVDFTRLGVYATQFVNTNLADHLPLVAGATVSGIIGSFVGNKLLKKITLSAIRVAVAMLLIVLSIALGMGWI